MATSNISSATINRATLIQAVKLAGKPVNSSEVAAICQAPDGYPMNQIMGNCKKHGYFNADKTGMYRGKPLNCYTVSEHGEEYLKKHSEHIQEFGEYEIIYKESKPQEKSSQSKLPLTSEPVFSPMVQEAMRELESVATMNEQARNCLGQLGKVIHSFKLLDINTELNLHGSLDLIQQDTASCVQAIEQIEVAIQELDKEAV